MARASTDDRIRVERQERVAVLTLNRPDRLNALDTATADRLVAVLDSLRHDDDVRALVIAGAGRGFCAGADLAQIESMGSAYEFRAFVQRLTEAFALLQSYPKPSVAAIHGFALGGGLELALACDLRVAESGAKLGLPEMKLGVLPGAGGTQRLPRLVPAGIAKQMILTGDPIDAERGYQVGLINTVAAPGETLAAALESAKTLAAGAPLALAAGKRLIDRAAGDLDAAICEERETVSVMYTSEDRAEGLRAFRDRRPGRFTGR